MRHLAFLRGCDPQGSLDYSNPHVAHTKSNPGQTNAEGHLRYTFQKTPFTQPHQVYSVQHILPLEKSIVAYCPSVLHTCGAVLYSAGWSQVAAPWRDLSVGSDGDGLSWRRRDSVRPLCTTEPVLNQVYCSLYCPLSQLEMYHLNR